MKIRLIALMLAGLVVVGCSPVSSPQSGSPIARFKSESAKAFVAGFQPADVYLRKDGSNAKLSAQCTINSSKYNVSFQSPGKVNLPAYSEGAVNITLSCTHEGETYSKVFEPVNLSRRARSNSAIGVAILCPICGIGMAAGNPGEKVGDIFGFFELGLEI